MNGVLSPLLIMCIYLSTILCSYEECKSLYGNAISKDIILPENSDYCKEFPHFRRFSLSRQMSFTTGIYNSSLNHLFYVCRVSCFIVSRSQFLYPTHRFLHFPVVDNFMLRRTFFLFINNPLGTVDKLVFFHFAMLFNLHCLRLLPVDRGLPL